MSSGTGGGLYNLTTREQTMKYLIVNLSTSHNWLTASAAEARLYAGLVVEYAVFRENGSVYLGLMPEEIV